MALTTVGGINLGMPHANLAALCRTERYEGGKRFSASLLDGPLAVRPREEHPCRLKLPDDLTVDRHPLRQVLSSGAPPALAGVEDLAALGRLTSQIVQQLTHATLETVGLGEDSMTPPVL